MFSYINTLTFSLNCELENLIINVFAKQEDETRKHHKNLTKLAVSKSCAAMPPL